MKFLLLPLLSGLCLTPSGQSASAIEQPVAAIASVATDAPSVLTFQDKPGSGKMSSIAFKNQDYCRAELENFDFDYKFSVISAKVYFSGANFKGVETGAITSNSLKPVKPLMDRCLPGSIVVFDDVKVKGSDGEIRTIPGLALRLY